MGLTTLCNKKIFGGNKNMINPDGVGGYRTLWSYQNSLNFKYNTWISS